MRLRLPEARDGGSWPAVAPHGAAPDHALPAHSLGTVLSGLWGDTRKDPPHRHGYSSLLRKATPGPVTEESVEERMTHGLQGACRAGSVTGDG